MSRRYEIEFSSSWEVGVKVLWVEVSTRTRHWANGPIITDAEDFVELTPEARRLIRNLGRQFGSLDALREAVEVGDVTDVDVVEIDMVVAGCKSNRPYLPLLGSGEFLSEAEVVAYAKEGEPVD